MTSLTSQGRARGIDERFWRRFFVAAALFNFVFGFPMLLAPRWAYDVAYTPQVDDDPTMTYRLLVDFGFAVVLIGVGYYLVARDVTRNRGMVWLGVFAKAYDVGNLTYRWAIDVAEPIVLIPAAVDGAFAVGFVAFLLVTKRARSAG